MQCFHGDEAALHEDSFVLCRKIINDLSTQSIN